MPIANAQAADAILDPTTTAQPADASPDHDGEITPHEDLVNALDFFMETMLDKVDPDLRVAFLVHVESARDSVSRAARVCAMQPAA